MATIRASCYDCGDVELTTADVHVRVCTLDNQGTYSFRCPLCTMTVVKPAEAEQVRAIYSLFFEKQSLVGTSQELNRRSPCPAGQYSTSLGARLQRDLKEKRGQRSGRRSAFPDGAVAAFAIRKKLNGVVAGAVPRQRRLPGSPATPGGDATLADGSCVVMVRVAAYRCPICRRYSCDQTIFGHLEEAHFVPRW